MFPRKRGAIVEILNDLVRLQYILQEHAGHAPARLTWGTGQLTRFPWPAA